MKFRWLGCLCAGLTAGALLAPRRLQAAEPPAPQVQALEHSVAKIKESLRSTEEGKVKDVAAWRPAPADEEAGASGFSVFKALGVCLGLFFIGVAVYKRMRGGAALSGGRRMRMLERLAVSPKTHLVLVEVDGVHMVVAVGAERVSFGGELAGGEPPIGLHKSMELVCAEDLKLSA